MIYRPRLRFSCIPLVFVASAGFEVRFLISTLDWSGSYLESVEKNLSAVQVFLKEAHVWSDR